MLKKTLYSFWFAVRGFMLALGERNMKIHLAAVLCVALAGVFFQVTRTEWLALIFACGLVLVAELLNTAVERTVDLITKECPNSYRDAGAPKDIAAAAVLTAAITAFCIALFVFIPYII